MLGKQLIEAVGDGQQMRRKDVAGTVHGDWRKKRGERLPVCLSDFELDQVEGFLTAADDIQPVAGIGLRDREGAAVVQKHLIQNERLAGKRISGSIDKLESSGQPVERNGFAEGIDGRDVD